MFHLIANGEITWLTIKNEKNRASCKVVKGKGDLKAPQPCITQGVKQQKCANPSKARHQIQKMFIIHIELKSYVPIVLKY